MNASNSRVSRPLREERGSSSSRVRVEGGSSASRVRVETRTRDVGCDLYRSSIRKYRTITSSHGPLRVHLISSWSRDLTCHIIYQL